MFFRLAFLQLTQGHIHEIHWYPLAKERAMPPRKLLLRVKKEQLKVWTNEVTWYVAVVNSHRRTESFQLPFVLLVLLSQTPLFSLATQLLLE